MARRKAVETASTAGQAKKQTRRVNVLSTFKVSKGQKELFEANAQDSPLLCLPPELRTRIWSLVLGGNTFHVRRNKVSGGRDVHLSICCCPQRDREALAKLKTSFGDGDPVSTTNYIQRHATCFSNLPIDLPQQQGLLDLRLLTVCRQIHGEAALLPFKGNTWSIDEIDTVPHFLKSPVHGQANAVECISVEIPRRYQTSTMGELIRTKMKGLKRLECFIGTSRDISDGGTLTTQKYYWSGTGSMLDTVMQFKQCPLMKVTIALFQCPDAEGNVKHRLSQAFEDAQAWVAEVERKLLPQG